MTRFKSIIIVVQDIDKIRRDTDPESFKSVTDKKPTTLS